MKKQSAFESLSLPLGMGVLFLLSGCAHATLEKQVDKKMSQETSVNSRADLRTESDDLIRSAPGLSDDQRQKLTMLRSQTTSTLDSLSENSLKLRAILVQDLLQTPYNEDEVELIKERLSKIEDQRLNAMFAAVKQANQILGRQAMQNHTLIDGFIDGHGSRD